MASLSHTLRGIDKLDVSFERRAAMTKAVRTGRLQDLPWAAFRPPLEVPDGLLLDERYRLGASIGAGGFGGVFHADDLLTGRRVAVKILDHFSPDVSRRMLQEIAVLRRLDLPCVVGFLDEGDLQGRPYVVMPYMQGEPFPGTDHDGSWKALGPRLLSLAEALARVHGIGVLHRDIKPDNVLWTDGRPVLIDFGLAMAEQLVFEKDDELAGSPAYLAPEQYLGDEPTERSDLYAFGVLMYETLCGELPFAGDKALDVITQLLTQEPDPLTERCEVPAGVADLVHQLLVKEPADRPKSALHVVTTLRAFVALPEGLPDPESVRHPTDLERWFAGPEMLHHLRSDPAQILWRRTGGDPEVVRQSLASWVRAGVARIDANGRIAMARDVVDRMMSGMTVDPCRGDGVGTEGLDVELQRLWLVVDALDPWATEHRLAAVLDREVADVLQGLQTLMEQALVTPVPEDGQAEGWLAVRTPPRPDGAHARRLHDLVADQVPPDANAYLSHLIQAGRMDDVPEASLRVARARRAEGRHLQAWLAAREGLAAERRLGLDSTEALVLAVELTLEGNMGQELEVVALAARRRGEVDLAGLCTYARSLHLGTAEASGLDTVDVSRFPELKDWPHSLTGYLLQHGELEVHRAWLAKVLPQLDVYEARFLQSRLEIRNGNVLRAAELGEASIKPTMRGPRAVSRRLVAVNGWLDVGRFDRATALLTAAQAELQSIRSGALSAYATCLARSHRYRSALPIEPSPEFVEALEHLQSLPFIAFMLLLEASIAWRCGEDDLALEYASKVQSVAHLRIGAAWLADAIVASVRNETDASMVERAMSSKSSVAMRAQMCAAHRLAGGTLSDEVIRQIHSELEASQYPSDARLEWLTPQEVRDAMEGRCPTRTS